MPKTYIDIFSCFDKMNYEHMISIELLKGIIRKVNGKKGCKQDENHYINRK